MNNFLRRTLTGAWIVIFVLGGFWLHPLSFFLTGLIIMTGALSEYFRLVRLTGTNPQTVPAIVTGAAAYILATISAAGVADMKYLLLLIPMFTAMLITELYRRKEKPFDSLAHTFFGLFYIGLPFCLFPFAAFMNDGLEELITFNGTQFSPGLVVGFFLLLWANDTGAYLAGITFGRHRLMERISPKKSWEGFAGGVLLAVVTAFLIAGWLGVIVRIQWIMIAIIISIAGTYGDLIESMLKRSTGVKDSGSVMPGHGGFLDRFDSTITAFPLVYLFILLFG